MEAKNTFSRQKIIKPMRIIIRPARREEWDDAMALAWRTFMKFEAEDYTDKGIKALFPTGEQGHAKNAFKKEGFYENNKRRYS